jgi:hypothetical protein
VRLKAGRSFPARPPTSVAPLNLNECSTDSQRLQLQSQMRPDTVSAAVKSSRVGSEGDRPETNGVSAIAAADGHGQGHGWGWIVSGSRPIGTDQTNPRRSCSLMRL